MTTDPPTPLSARVNLLFRVFHAKGEPEQTSDEVAKAVSAATGASVSRTVIDGLRRGDPGDAALLTALAAHFGAPAAYLLAPDSEVVVLHRKLRFLAEARDAGTRLLALRGDMEPTADPTELLDRILES
ncbi:hypothetical protein [Nocardia sp. NPDC052566]|uniref:hypothetical protein n=1 Tax=Nocardia sp. NPDC052566 TaxID=3364330 RepID=UPI0037C54C06